jgi:hypothetical protein
MLYQVLKRPFCDGWISQLSVEPKHAACGPGTPISAAEKGIDPNQAKEIEQS